MPSPSPSSLFETLMLATEPESFFPSPLSSLHPIFWSILNPNLLLSSFQVWFLVSSRTRSSIAVRLQLTLVVSFGCFVTSLCHHWKSHEMREQRVADWLGKIEFRFYFRNEWMVQDLTVNREIKILNIRYTPYKPNDLIPDRPFLYNLAGPFFPAARQEILPGWPKYPGRNFFLPGFRSPGQQDLFSGQDFEKKNGFWPKILPGCQEKNLPESLGTA